MECASRKYLETRNAKLFLKMCQTIRSRIIDAIFMIPMYIIV